MCWRRAARRSCRNGGTLRTLANSVAAEPLTVAIAQRASGGTCAWVYEVGVLTSRGNVAVLDFDINDLDLTRVEGPVTDPDIAALFERLERGGGSREPGEATAGGDSSAAGSDGGGGEGGDGGGGGGEGGEGGGDD